MSKNKLYCILASTLILWGCSTTSGLEDGEVLYTGIKDIHYSEHENQTAKDDGNNGKGVIASLADAYQTVDNLLNSTNLQQIQAFLHEHKGGKDKDEEKKLKKQLKKVEKQEKKAFEQASVEVEAALACAPNASLFGSSSMRSPLPIGLWFYNGLLHSEQPIAKWMFHSFSSYPVLISNVNPDLRSTIATNILHNYGYFNGKVNYNLDYSSNKKKAKVNYWVKMGKLYKTDSVFYSNFPAAQDSLIQATRSKSLLSRGNAFSVVSLDGERQRLATLFRNNGFFYYQNDYITYKADTLQHPGYVQLQALPLSHIPDVANRRWYLGRTDINVRKDYADPLDSCRTYGRRKNLALHYAGKKSPLRMRTILQNIAYRPGELYREDDQTVSIDNLRRTGMFSNVDITYTPIDTLGTDTLNVTINATLDKPYDGEFELNATTKSNSQTGPGASFGLVKRNAFRGGEKVTFKIHGSYEWETRMKDNDDKKRINSYNYGTSLKFDFPRFIFPLFNNRRRRRPITSTFSLDANWRNRSGFYNTVGVSLKSNYTYRPNNQTTHEFSPLTLDYNELLHTTSEFNRILLDNPALYLSMSNQFIPCMRYGLTLSSRSEARNPRTFNLEVKESGGITSCIYAAAGEPFNKKDKELFKNPFAQFVKLTGEFRESIKLTHSTSLAWRIRAGYIYTYGNSTEAPYNEQFYVGGANSIRAFTVRTIGPGSYHTDHTEFNYLDQTGNLKLEGNLELRFPLYGSLKGAVFLDAGNVWLTKKDDLLPGGEFHLKNLPKELATGTGFGFRYDMEFLVLRLDMGIGIHLPYDTSRKGYYNIPTFKDALGIHFAVGYPF